MKKPYLLAGVTIIAAIALFAWSVLSKGSAPANSTGASSTWSGPMSPEEAAKKRAPALDTSVETILTASTQVLQEAAGDENVVQAVREKNDSDRSLSLVDIRKIDEAWQSSWTQPAEATKDIRAFIAQFMTNSAAQTLLNFQNAHPEFKEIFVADAYGLNVGQTDKTSDYYQADEAWWVNSYNGGKGMVAHGAIEFDKSAQTEAISLYVPVMDGGKAIGVIKAVMDVTFVSEQL